jgi:hypothetical protein
MSRNNGTKVAMGKSPFVFSKANRSASGAITRSRIW